jgi:phenylacetate-CoA ligase
MLEILSRNVFYPLWDWKDRSSRLREYSRLDASQWWPSDRLQALQLERVREAVSYAFAHCPYYREAWGRLPRIDSLADLAQIPLLPKQAVRERLHEIRSDEYALTSLVAAKTGGSTGRALDLYFDVRCQEWRNAAALRSDGWAGWRPGMLLAALWGTPSLPTTLKERIRNALHDRVFFLDTMKLNDDSMGAFARELTRREPGALFGHAHSLFVFARFIEEHGLAVPQLQAIIATSMMLLESERVVISRVFRCPVTNRYGCEEVGLIACECEKHSGLHVNAEHVHVEILRADGAPAEPGEEGQIVVTDLINKGMPLIRYAIEDMACWSNRSCECGRALPLIERIVGRVADFLRRRDGSLVAGVSLVEKTVTAIPGLEQLQIVQAEMTRFELNLVASDGFDETSQSRLRTVLHDVFGNDVEVQLNRMARIPQERNSKYRFAICKVGG